MTPAEKPSPVAEVLQSIDRHIAAHREKLNTLWHYRFWLLLGVLGTMLLPVLQNLDGVTLTGYDLCEPTLNRFNANGMIIGVAWAINPLMVAIYAWAAFHAYAAYSHRRPKREFLMTCGVFVLALSTPLTFTLSAIWFIPHNSMAWHADAPMWGWYVLIVLSGLLAAAGRAQDIGESEPVAKPPSSGGSIVAILLLSVVLSGCGQSGPGSVSGGGGGGFDGTRWSGEGDVAASVGTPGEGTPPKVQIAFTNGQLEWHTQIWDGFDWQQHQITQAYQIQGNKIVLQDGTTLQILQHTDRQLRIRYQAGDRPLDSNLERED